MDNTENSLTGECNAEVTFAFVGGGCALHSSTPFFRPAKHNGSGCGRTEQCLATDESFVTAIALDYFRDHVPPLNANRGTGWMRVWIPRK
jgi:hypothetical protein